MEGDNDAGPSRQQPAEQGTREAPLTLGESQAPPQPCLTTAESRGTKRKAGKDDVVVVVVDDEDDDDNEDQEVVVVKEENEEDEEDEEQDEEDEESEDQDDEDEDDEERDDEDEEEDESTAQSSVPTPVQPETRIYPLCRGPPYEIDKRVDRALNQSMLLVHRSGLQRGPPPASERGVSASQTSTVISEEFKVAGSTGNIYTVRIGTVPRCDCPDHGGLGDTACKHILFVWLRVLGVSQRSHVWYQHALLQSELRDVFRRARSDHGIHNPALTRAWKQKAAIAARAAQMAAAGEVEKKVPHKEGQFCPVCQEDFVLHSQQGLWFCVKSCGNPVHKTCLQHWRKLRQGMQRTATCPYCRHALEGSGSGSGSSSGSGGRDRRGEPRWRFAMVKTDDLDALKRREAYLDRVNRRMEEENIDEYYDDDYEGEIYEDYYDDLDEGYVNVAEEAGVSRVREYRYSSRNYYAGYGGGRSRRRW